MENHLENLTWNPRMLSHLGCLKGCIDYLGIDVSDAWLYGATGYAFIINICERNVCPSGPTAFNTQPLFELGRNAGYDFTNGVFGFKTDPDFPEKQQQAWDNVRKSLDDGTPCYGWELEAAEFYVISGYDDTGYYYSGPGADTVKGPKPWEELGNSDIGILEVYGVTKGFAADADVTVRESLEFALKHAVEPGDWVYPEYRSGLTGFDMWIDTVEKGEADGFGMGYNAAVWAECRVLGLKFLDEARDRLDPAVTPLLDEAIERYFPVVDGLSGVVSLFPLMPPQDGLSEEERFTRSLDYLKQARAAEEAALSSLERIVGALA